MIDSVYGYMQRMRQVHGYGYRIFSQTEGLHKRQTIKVRLTLCIKIKKVTVLTRELKLHEVIYFPSIMPSPYIFPLLQLSQLNLFSTSYKLLFSSTSHRVVLNSCYFILKLLCMAIS